MKKAILPIIFFLSTLTLSAQTEKDTQRLAELDAYWTQLSKTVKEGDYKGYGDMYHPDAVVIFASGKNKSSMPIANALAGWKKGFDETKAGNRNDTAEFRFSQRIGNKTTAHETGIFRFTTRDASHKVTGTFIVHFEMLLVKKEGKWLGVMEYQKTNGTKEEWDALK